MVASMSATRYTACSMRRLSCFAQSAVAAIALTDLHCLCVCKVVQVKGGGEQLCCAWLLVYLLFVVDLVLVKALVSRGSVSALHQA